MTTSFDSPRCTDSTASLSLGGNSVSARSDSVSREKTSESKRSSVLYLTNEQPNGVFNSFSNPLISDFAQLEVSSVMIHPSDSTPDSTEDAQKEVRKALLAYFSGDANAKPPPLYQLELSDGNVFISQSTNPLLLLTLSGSTIMAWVHKEYIFMACDGLGFGDKVFVRNVETRLRRREDFHDDVTEDFSEGSECKKYYTKLLDIIKNKYGISKDEDILIKNSWEIRKNEAVLDTYQKTGLLGSGSNTIMYSYAGLSQLVGYVVALLENLEKTLSKAGRVLDITLCANECSKYLSAAKPSQLGFPENYQKFGGCFLLGSHENQEPKLFYVDKTDGCIPVTDYACAGVGDWLAKRVLKTHYTKDNGKDLVLLRMREAMEAASVMRQSGGTMRIISLDKDNNYSSELTEKIGCI